MAVQKQDGLHTDVMESATDLTGKEDLFVTRNSEGKAELCGEGEVIAGVISEGRAAGYHTSYNTKGNPILRVTAGEALAVGTEVQSNSAGQAMAGSTNPIGKTRSAAGNSGEIVSIETYST